MLSAVREGDPLAYGEERLRQARSIYAADLSRVEPADERERRELGRNDNDTSRRTCQTTAPAERRELSLIVAELDEAIEAFEPSPLQRGILTRSAGTILTSWMR